MVVTNSYYRSIKLTEYTKFNFIIKCYLEPLSHSLNEGKVAL